MRPCCRQRCHQLLHHFSAHRPQQRGHACRGRVADRAGQRMGGGAVAFRISRRQRVLAAHQACQSWLSRHNQQTNLTSCRVEGHCCRKHIGQRLQWQQRCTLRRTRQQGRQSLSFSCSCQGWRSEANSPWTAARVTAAVSRATDGCQTPHQVSTKKAACLQRLEQQQIRGGRASPGVQALQRASEKAGLFRSLGGTQHARIVQQRNVDTPSQGSCCSQEEDRWE